ncbi:G patch domain-containing protein 1-like, partial [Lampetra fluviatilis]
MAAPCSGRGGGRGGGGRGGGGGRIHRARRDEEEEEEVEDDDEEEEDLVTYGNPLPDVPDDAPLRRKPVPLAQQAVRDEGGRFRRFHGAFTGGFSAGFYNTVGSREGECHHHYYYSLTTTT